MKKKYQLPTFDQRQQKITGRGDCFIWQWYFYFCHSKHYFRGECSRWVYIYSKFPHVLWTFHYRSKSKCSTHSQRLVISFLKKYVFYESNIKKQKLLKQFCCISTQFFDCAIKLVSNLHCIRPPKFTGRKT